MAALGDVARTRDIGQLARDAGMRREEIAHALSRDVDPNLSTVIKISRALGLRLIFLPAAPAA